MDCISKQFFEMVPVRRMTWKDDEAALLVTSPDLQRHLLLATVQHPICQSCPPALSYRRYFMKQLIQKLESEDADICDEIYEAYTEMLSLSEDDDEPLCFKTYKMPNGRHVSLRESVHLVSQGTTGLSTWQAAEHLAEWIIENPQIIANRSVVELGSGQGLTGISTCLQCQPHSYTFTDCHPQVLSLLAGNIQHNLDMTSAAPRDTPCHNTHTDPPQDHHRAAVASPDLRPANSTRTTSVSSQDDVDEICSDRVELEVSGAHWELDKSRRCATLKVDTRVAVCHFDWECVKSKLLQKLKSDIILAADVVYDTSIIPALVFVLRSLLHTGVGCNRQPKAFIASTIRNEDTRDEFLIALGSEGLSYSVIEPPKQSLFFYDKSVPIEIISITAT